MALGASRAAAGPLDPSLDLENEIVRLEKERHAVIPAHYYQDSEIPAPPEADCACNECPHMKKNTVEKVYLSLRDLEPRRESGRSDVCRDRRDDVVGREDGDDARGPRRPFGNNGNRGFRW